MPNSTAASFALVSEMAALPYIGRNAEAPSHAAIAGASKVTSATERMADRRLSRRKADQACPLGDDIDDPLRHYDHLLHGSPVQSPDNRLQLQGSGLDLGLKNVTAVLEQATANPDGSLTWIGHVRETAKFRTMTAREVRHDGNNSVILVRRGQGVTGNVRVNGQLYRIRPLPDGSHAVIEVNERAMPPDHPAAFRDLPQINMAAPSGMVGALAIDPGATATIRVLVVATNAAVSAYGGDMQALAQLAVAESNQGYVNSNVGINMELDQE